MPNFSGDLLMGLSLTDWVIEKLQPSVKHYWTPQIKFDSFPHIIKRVNEGQPSVTGLIDFLNAKMNKSQVWRLARA